MTYLPKASNEFLATDLSNFCLLCLSAIDSERFFISLYSSSACFFLEVPGLGFRGSFVYFVISFVTSSSISNGELVAWDSGF